VTEGSYARIFWVALVIGTAIMGFGVVSLVQRFGATRPPSFALFFLGAIALHDFVLTPVVLAFGRLVSPRLPLPARGSVLGAAIVTGTVTLASVPVVFRFGRLASNPSLLPRDSALGLLVVLLAVWFVTGVLVWRAVRHTSARER
jgi:hypothetical protein